MSKVETYVSDLLYDRPSLSLSSLHACDRHAFGLLFVHAAYGRSTREPQSLRVGLTGKDNSRFDLSHDVTQWCFISEKPGASSSGPITSRAFDDSRKQKPSRLRASIVTHYRQCGTDP
jgi:hypothetical protein